ncbi:MAG: WXG100 family type VII secretion target [Anaerolineae bacterium]|jgi:uncharacterized protein YukE|nr:WXG100 family type VII secretion target [Anaerolineae bacterium]
MGILKRILLKIARMVLQQVLNQITQQLNIVEDQVKARLEGFVKEVVGGVWKGDGANRFVDEISSEAIPMLGNLAESIVNIGSSIRSAEQIMDQADARCRQIAESLTSVFEGI